MFTTSAGLKAVAEKVGSVVRGWWRVRKEVDVSRRKAKAAKQE
jgi:hypothetical protein